MKWGETGRKIEMKAAPIIHVARMLILTHNNYFYNVASSNGAVPRPDLFKLMPGVSQHSLASQKGFATPHQQQFNPDLPRKSGTVWEKSYPRLTLQAPEKGGWERAIPDHPVEVG
jgi:hypothetical protein